MAADRGGGGRAKRRKRPAYPKPGSGEDFPTRRPGTKIRETSSGGKIMQHTRAESARISVRNLQHEEDLPFRLSHPIPLAGKSTVQREPYDFAHPFAGGGYPGDDKKRRFRPVSVDTPTARRTRTRRV